MVSTVQTKLNPASAIYDEVAPARQPWSRIVKKGQTLRIVDLQGNQATECLKLESS